MASIETHRDHGRKQAEAVSTVNDARTGVSARTCAWRGALIGLGLSLLASASGTWGAPAEREVQIIVPTAIVRAQPSTTAPVLFKAPRGAIFRVVDQQGDWYLVAAPSRQPGYVHRSVVEVREPSPAEPASQPSPSPTPAAPAASAAPKIDHTPLECVRANDFPLVDAGVTSSTDLYRTRAYFKAHQYPDWYYVEMKVASAPQYTALLPQPLPGTQQVDYYLDALDTGLNKAQTAHYGPVVSRKGCDTDEAAGARDRTPPEITVRGTKEGQPPVPPGFSKKGIIAFVTVAGATLTGAALTTGGATTAGAAAAGTGSAGAGGGISTTTLAVVGGGVAAAGVGVAVATSGGSSEETPGCMSPSEIAKTSGGAFVAVGNDTICTAWVPCANASLRSCVSHYCAPSGCSIYYEFTSGSRHVCTTNCGNGDYSAYTGCVTSTANECAY